MFGLTMESQQITTTGFAGTSDCPDHYEKNKMEKEFVFDRVRKLFGEPPEGPYLKWKGNEHDFGMYYELTIFWDPRWINNDDKVWDWINKVESHDWETEENELKEMWVMHEVDDLSKDNEVFKLID